MNSRERVRAALNHEESDRVPVDFGDTGRQASPPSPMPGCAII